MSLISRGTASFSQKLLVGRWDSGVWYLYVSILNIQGLIEPVAACCSLIAVYTHIYYNPTDRNCTF